MKKLILTAIILLSTTTAHAQVAMSEIMYAPSGSDDKHEWIEVCTSSDSYDIKELKLFENSVAHGLVQVRGTSQLGSGSCAVIADDATTFLSDFSSFSGNLFDSSFSLTNTGESLSLRSGTGVTIDSITYTDASGAKDDGNSLHRASATTFTAGSSSPGVETGFAIGGSTAGGTNDTTVANTSNTTSPNPIIQFHTVTIEPPPTLTLRVGDKMTVPVGTLVHFTAEAFNAKGSVVDAQVRWAFGDGYSDTGKKVAHTFQKEGVYIVYAEASAESLSAESQVLVTVVPASIRLATSGQNDIAVANDGEVVLDLSGSKLSTGYQVYVFPDGTRIAPHASVTFPQRLTKLTEMTRTDIVSLVLADGSSVANAKTIQQAVEDGVVKKTPTDIFSFLPFGSQVVTAAPIASVSEGQKESLVATEGTVSEPQPQLTGTSSERLSKKLSDAQASDESEAPLINDDTSIMAAAASTAGGGDSTSPLYRWLVALMVIIGVALTPVFLSNDPASQKQSEVSNTNELTAKDFEIIDVTERNS